MDKEIIDNVLIDPNLDSYQQFFDHRWCKHMFEAVETSPLKDAVSALMVAWRSANGSHLLPWLMVHSLKRFAEGEGDGSLRFRANYSGEVVKGLVGKLESKMQPSLKLDQRMALKRVVARIEEEAHDALKTAQSQVGFPLAGYWDFLTHSSEFQFSILGTQRINYGSLFFAYEDFLANVIRSKEPTYTSKKKPIKDAFPTHIGDSLADFCWNHDEVNLARLVRNALAHNGGRFGDDLEKYYFGVKVAHNSSCHLRPFGMGDGIMAFALPDARQLSDEVLEALRLRALRGCTLGFGEADVADLLGVSRETVSRWWSAYTAGGLEALPHDRTGRPPGSGRILDDGQAAHLQQLIDGHSPEDLGIAAPLWTRRAVRDLIRQELAITLPVRTVGEYLRRWGYTAKRPRRHARDQDPAEVRAWLRQTYPAIEARAYAEGAEIYWGDETGVAADEHPGRGYARIGEAAVADVPDGHIRVNMIAAVTNAGAVRFMTYPGAMTAALFLVFLERLLSGARRKAFLIVDRLKAHDAAPVKAWVAARPDRIELFYLPRRAPELNADEYLNNDLKGSVNAAGLPHGKGELQGHVEAFMHKLAQLPERIKSYFQHPCTRYAAAMNL